jgi:hypothetical protein
MRISGFRQESVGSTVRLSANFEWEDSDLPVDTVRYEVEGVSPEETSPGPEAFAIRGALAAFHANERRVLVHGSLCPRLRDGLRTALRTLRSWYSPEREEPAIEATGGFRILPQVAPQAALFLSGGSDSLCALRTNRENYPSNHPSSFRVAIFLPTFGMQLEAFSSPRVVNLLSRQKRAIGEIARRTGLRVISASLLAGELGEDSSFSSTCSHSSHLAAAGHLFSPLLSSVSMAAGYDVTDLTPWGSHPLLDPNYSSSSLEVRHEEFGFTREERVAAVARWNEILPLLLVCSEGPVEPGVTNCGRCEKCVRTMIALLLVDRLAKDGPFRQDDLTVAHLEGLTIQPQVLTFWEDFPAALRRRGRDDLARAAERLLSEGRKHSKWFRDRGWKGGLRRLDRRFLGGRLLQASRRIRAARVAPGRH